MLAIRTVLQSGAKDSNVTDSCIELEVTFPVTTARIKEFVLFFASPKGNDTLIARVGNLGRACIFFLVML